MARIVKMGGFGMSPNIEKLISVPVENFVKTSVNQIKLKATAGKPLNMACESLISFKDVFNCAKTELLPLFSERSSLVTKHRVDMNYGTPEFSFFSESSMSKNKTNACQKVIEKEVGYNALVSNKVHKNISLKSNLLSRESITDVGMSTIDSLSGQSIAKKSTDEALFRSQYSNKESDVANLWSKLILRERV